MGRLLKGQGSQKTCLTAKHSAEQQGRIGDIFTGQRRLGAALRAITLEGLFF
jgi:hypothetical protein